MSEEFNKEEKEIEMENRRWKHRRRLAYLSFLALIVTVGLVFFAIPKEKLEVLSNVITWIFFTFGGIIGAYVGFSTIEKVKWTK